MHFRILLGICAILLASPPAFAQTPAPAGRIKTVSGAATVGRAAGTLPVRVGDAVYASDVLRTGADGRVGLTLQDDTRVSLAPNSEMRLDRFAFAPADGRLALAIRFVRGVAAYVSGRIAKLAPDAVRLETPAAIVGVRGTTLVIRVDVP